MMKYIKMIPLMLYPYAYLIPLIGIICTPHDNESAIDAMLKFICIYAIALHVIVLVIAIYNTIVSAKGKYTAVSAARINLLTKCVQIPAYIFHFILALIGLCMSIWGIGFILFAIIVDLFTIILTGVSSIGCSCLIRKKGYLSKRVAILTGIGSFMYCIDVAIAIIYFIVAKRKEDNFGDSIINKIKSVTKQN